MPIPVGALVPADLVTPNIRPPGTMLGAFSVSLGDFVAGVVHPSGANIHIKKLTGWWDSPSSTGTETQRANDHGAWIDPAYYGPRVISLDVQIDAHTWDHVTPIIDELLAAVTLNDLTDFTVSDARQTLVAAVRQEGDPVVDRSGSRALVSVSLVAPDPRRYDPFYQSPSTKLPLSSGGLSLPISLPLSIGATVSTGRLSAVNEGNMETRPVLVVTGPCPAFTVAHLQSGRQLSALDAVPAGRKLYLDTDQRVALIDGAVIRVVTGSWFTFGPGLNEVQFGSASYDAAASLAAIFRSAWR